jgi:hypothetical protein
MPNFFDTVIVAPQLRGNDVDTLACHRRALAAWRRVALAPSLSRTNCAAMASNWLARAPPGHHRTLECGRLARGPRTRVSHIPNHRCVHHPRQGTTHSCCTPAVAEHGYSRPSPVPGAPYTGRGSRGRPSRRPRKAHDRVAVLRTRCAAFVSEQSPSGAIFVECLGAFKAKLVMKVRACTPPPSARLTPRAVAHPVVMSGIIAVHDFVVSVLITDDRACPPPCPYVHRSLRTAVVDSDKSCAAASGFVFISARASRAG